MLSIETGHYAAQYPYLFHLILKTWHFFCFSSYLTVVILANRPDLVRTVPIWRPKPDVPPDDPKKPIRPDLSRSTPKNTILNPLFACSLCSSVGIQVSSVSFGRFSCTRLWQAVIQQKICIYWGIVLVKSSFSCHFPLNARNFVYILGLFFLAGNVWNH